MSCRQTALGLLVGVCALSCAAEERDFGGSDAGLHGGDHGHSSADERTDAAMAGDAAAGNLDGSLSSSEPSASTDETEPVSDEHSNVGESEPQTDPDGPSSSEPGPSSDEDTSDPDPDSPDAATDPDEMTGSDPADAAASPQCVKDSNCDDLNPCNGEEECVEGACALGAWPDNGAQCELGDSAALRVCSNGNCILSICGDGYTDDRSGEACDDANATNSDGCTVACEYSCTADEQCDDDLLCNGLESCDPELHACVVGENADDQTTCDDGHLCHAGSCVPEGCGNGELEAGEVCDDGNLDPGDGCEADCTYSCADDAACDDGSVCTGSETCDPDLHVCLPGEELECEAPDACTAAECDAVSGCYYPLIDGDGDGQASSDLECGSDCDDDDIAVYAGAAELCDGKDNNCNDSTDETAPTWYPDCDGDGFAPANSAGTQQCETPVQPPNGCAVGLVGAWTATAPVSGNADCWDESAAVHPMDATENNVAWSTSSIEGRPVSVDYDYNCDDVEEPHDDDANLGIDGTCSPPVFQAAAFSAQAGGGGGIIIAPVLLCNGVRGWSGDEPACGASGNWTYCSGSSGSCTRVKYSTAYKKCR